MQTDAAAEPAHRRLEGIDPLRGLVCLSILVMHFYFGPQHDALAAGLGSALDWVVTHLRFGYETFFLLAGFFLAHSFRPGPWDSLSVKLFFRRRLVRLAVPYWIAILLGVVGWHLRALVAGIPAPDGWTGFWPMLIFAHDLIESKSPNIALWFMGPLFQFYLFWGLMFWVVRRGFLAAGAAHYHDRTLVVMAVLTGVVLFVSIAVVWTGVGVPGKLAPNALYLALGCFVYWTSIRFLSAWWLGLMRAVSTAGGVVNGSSRWIASVVAALLLLWLAMHPQLPNSRLIRGLGVIGRISFSIYLTQMLVGPRILHLPGHWSLDLSFASAAAVLLAAVVCCIAFGALFYLVVEIPVARLSSDMGRGPGRSMRRPEATSATGLEGQRQDHHGAQDGGAATVRQKSSPPAP
jgi:peptidoglycan/LPS O-acetylase OafA/YrhL